MSDARRIDYGSECCGARYVTIPEMVIKPSLGVTCYYTSRCEECGKPCHAKELRRFDSSGVEILPGDLIEVPELGEGHAEHWHICYLDDGDYAIRDLGNNNLYMLDCYDEYFNRGPFWRHLDKVDYGDLQYYFGLEPTVAKRMIEDSKVKP